MAVTTTTEIRIAVGLRKRCWVDPAMRVLSYAASAIGEAAALIARYGIVPEVRRDAAR